MLSADTGPRPAPIHEELVGMELATVTGHYAAGAASAGVSGVDAATVSFVKPVTSLLA